MILKKEKEEITKSFLQNQKAGTGMKVWQSYLENKTSGAMRMYWVYGPDQKDITIIGLEPHSEDKKMVHTTEFHCQICRIKLNMEF